MVRQLRHPGARPHKKNAEKLINYYYDPAVMAQVAAYVNYIAPCREPKEEMVKIDPELAENPLIFPPASFLAGAQVFRGLTAAEETKYGAICAKVVGN